MLIGPNQQKVHARIIGERIKVYKFLYAFTLLISALIIVLFFRANYNINYIQEEYYVYGDNKHKLNPEFDEEIPPINTIIADNITPIIDTIQPKPDIEVVDLRKYFSVVKNQGRQASCLAFALSAIMEYNIKVRNSETKDFSEAFLYYRSREISGEEKFDKGSRFIYAIECLQKDGICQEMFMPYDEFEYLSAPSQSAFYNALPYKVNTVNTVDLELNDLRSVLQKGFPIAISVNMYSSFGNGKNGVVPLPKNREINGGSHAMVIVGYNDGLKQFIVRNSWGTSFGDNGYCYMPYEYITNSSLTNYACVVLN